MAQSITMPKLGLTMSEGTISKWNKAEGDAVAVGEVLFVVSTDKLTYEYQSEVSGVLLKIEVPENCSIAVARPARSSLRSPCCRGVQTGKRRLWLLLRCPLQRLLLARKKSLSSAGALVATSAPSAWHRWAPTSRL